MPNSAGNDSSTLQGGVRLGGVRADFVAALGKRLAELRQHWDALVDAPASPGLRNEFRRHLHALATRSRVLHFEAMADRLDRAERRLQRAATAGGIDAEDVELFDELFRELPALAWIEVGGKQPAESRADSEENEPETPAKAAPEAAPAFPLAVLVIGRPPLAQSLEDQGIDPEGLALDVEQTERLDNALQLTQALAPDVVVLDGDLAGATIVSETLARDPITDSTPVIVVGTWSHADQASDFLAHGVVRTLPKPVSPAKLRKAIREAFENKNRVDQNDDIGAVTVDELAERLAQQVRSSLIDAVRPESRRVSVDLGQGTEVLAAVWGAVARVREMLTIRSQGTIRFNNVGPVGAVPVAPWLDIKSTDNARRDGGRETEQDAKLLLDGRRVLVVDDDPAITWFLSGLFRAHGSTVKEAQDGMRGLELAFQFDPDLVITDILMPKLDGFGLCRALKRDVILRDVPVILLSWKEDLLQRVRELGVGADGYLRKEATSSAILRTVQESLRPRTRIEERLRQGGEVRGRLDGLTARTLLTLVSKTLPNACVNVRDARHLFEVQLRDGQIQQATRTSLDGASVRGDEALISVVRVFTGRFQVVPAQDVVEPSTTRPLRDIVAPAVAEARAAQVLLEGANLLRANRLALRLERLELESLPKATREVYEALAKGTSPTRLIDDGVVTAASLEQLLSDAATRGAIASVLDAEGTDLLVDESKARLRAWMSPLEARTVQRASKTRDQEEAHTSDDSPARGPKPTMPCPADAESDASEVASSKVTVEQLEPPIDLSEFAADDKSEEKDEPKASFRDLGDAPTSLAEAVIREVADSAEMPASKPSPSMLDVSELRPRSTARPTASSIPSLPPDAIVPGAESLAEQPEEPSEPSIPEVPSMPPPPEDVSVVAAQYELVGGVGAAQANEASALQPPSTREDESKEDDEEGEDEDEEEEDDQEDEDEDEDEDEEDDESKAKAGEDQAKDGSVDEIPKRSLLLPVLAVVGIVGGLIAAAVYLGGPTPPSSPAAPESSELEGPSIPIPAPPDSALPGAPDAVDTATKAVEGAYVGKVQEGLPIDGPGEAPVDQGLVEVKTGHPNAAVTIDGRDLGEGEVIRMFLGPGKHRVMVVRQGKQLRGEVDVRVGEKTRLSLEDAWGP